ncbi:GNAT family N-acetyltransferase [Nocardioides sp. InS609-2]|uniref:GNAT family N-acetyltransferase n=1 Tax=Nocardioides sp. InS609-2 TaxID=2760705 RepID=UPI0020BE7F35|nr:GNAT family N-acetyltransferase [Nocardioides sp. InS609-2]
MHRLRPATSHDVDFLIDVVVTATRDQGRLPNDFDEAEWRAGFAEWTIEELASTSVIEVDGERVGRLRVVRREHEIELAGIQLLPAHQGHSLGTRIVEELLAESLDGGRSLALSVEKDNPRALAFYERLGLVRTGETDDEVQLRAQAFKGAGWYAVAPHGSRRQVLHTVEEPLRELGLMADEYTGPFRSDDGALGDDFDEVHRVTGISRELFDDVMAWNDEVTGVGHRPTGALFVRQQNLLRRLGEEVHPGIAVDSPQREPPVVVVLSSLNVDPDQSDRLVLWDEAALESGRAIPLPLISAALTGRITSWVADAWKYDHGTPQNNAALFEWQDEGSALGRELQEALGAGFHVLGR